MLYKILYTMMLVGYLGLSIQHSSPRMKIIGILLAIVNALLFWKF